MVHQPFEVREDRFGTRGRWLIDPRRHGFGGGAIGGMLVAQAIVERGVVGGCRVLLDVPSQVAARAETAPGSEWDGRRGALDVEEDRADRPAHTSAETYDGEADGLKSRVDACAVLCGVQPA